MQRVGRLAQRSLACLALLLMPVVPGMVPLAHAQAAAAATDQRIYEVKTRDGVRYYGYLQVDTPERVVIRTPGGATIELARADVVSVAEAHGTLVGQDFLPADSNPTRLFFGPTGRALKQGETTFGIYELFMPFVQVGVTDRFSIGGGTPLFIGGGDHPVWVTPKFQVQRNNRVSTSVGLMHFLNVGDDDFGIAYGASTIGNSNDAFTVGVGWAYENYSVEHNGTAMVMLGAERRLSRRVKFLTENYYVGGVVLVSGGFRYLGESLSADLGLVSPLGEGEVFAFPMINIVWKFHR